MGHDIRDHTPGQLPRLLHGLVDEDLEALLSSCRRTRAAARVPLLRAEEDRVLLFLGGAAKAHIVTTDGDAVITRLLGPGEVTGLVSVLGHANTGVDVTSLSAVDALSITGSALRRLLDSHPGLVAACLRTIGAEQAVSSQERARFAGTSTSQRVAHRLIELGSRWGAQEDGGIRITLPLSQEELASWSGASRESVAKALHALRKGGVIRTARRSVQILDIDGLRERCERPAHDDPHLLMAAFR
jgi:CRP/FNR family transcriptional regulator, cyclic AMP receptor protein